MKGLNLRMNGLGLAVLLFAFGGGEAFPAQKVPLNFDDYHGYTRTVEFLNAVAKAYPEITDLLEIGKSTSGRPIFVLVVTNKKTGMTMDAQVSLRRMRNEARNVAAMPRHQGKPGQWICGATHGNEYTGTEVCLYIIDKLLAGYGSNLEIKQLIDDKVFYICPVVNPDGVYNSVERGLSQRGNSMMKDDDGDGRVNEDGPDDLNGDGYVTQFRYQDPEGQYVMDDVDPRVMVRLEKDEKTTKPRFSVIQEDKDNDGDGKRGEDSEQGIDLNRNFPEGWFQDDGLPGGQGDYQTSAPEVRALAEFFTNHRNIFMAQFFHTSGGFTYRPMGSSPETSLHPKDIAVYDFILGKKYLELIGEEIPEAWKEPDAIDKFKAEIRGKTKNKYAIERGYEFPRGWRISYNEKEDKRYGHGLQADWVYMEYGAYSITTELWNPQKDLKEFPQLKEEAPRAERERALLQYQDEKFGGKYFIPWKKFKHPELGEGEVGGWIPKYRSNAYPGEPLLGVCETHWQYELFRARLLPQVVIGEVKARVLYSTDNAAEVSAAQSGDQVTIKKAGAKGKYRVVEITAKIENRGQLPTHVARGAALAGNREDVVWLIGDRNKLAFQSGTPFQKLGVLEGQMKIPGYVEKPEPSPERPPLRRGGMPPFLLMYPGFPDPMEQRAEEEPPKKQTGPAREIKWLVTIEGNSPLKVVVSSQRGGTKIKEVVVD